MTNLNEVKEEVPEAVAVLANLVSHAVADAYRMGWNLEVRTESLVPPAMRNTGFVIDVTKHNHKDYGVSYTKPTRINFVIPLLK